MVLPSVKGMQQRKGSTVTQLMILATLSLAACNAVTARTTSLRRTAAAAVECQKNGATIMCDTQAGNACQLKASRTCCSMVFYTEDGITDRAFCGTKVMGNCEPYGFPLDCNASVEGACETVAQERCCDGTFYVTEFSSKAHCGHSVTTTPAPADNCVKNGNPFLCNTQAGNACQLKAESSCCSKDYYTTEGNKDVAFCGTKVIGENNGGRRNLHEGQGSACEPYGFPLNCNASVEGACETVAQDRCCGGTFYTTEFSSHAHCGHAVSDSTTPAPADHCVKNGKPIVCNTQAGNACQLMAIRECCSQEYFTTDKKHVAFCGTKVY